MLLSYDWRSYSSPSNFNTVHIRYVKGSTDPSPRAGYTSKPLQAAAPFSPFPSGSTTAPGVDLGSPRDESRVSFAIFVFFSKRKEKRKEGLSQGGKRHWDKFESCSNISNAINGLLIIIHNSPQSFRVQTNPSLLSFFHWCWRNITNDHTLKTDALLFQIFTELVCKDLPFCKVWAGNQTMYNMTSLPVKHYY